MRALGIGVGKKRHSSMVSALEMTEGLVSIYPSIHPSILTYINIYIYSSTQ